MDSPPEYLLALPCDPPLSSPAMPSLDHSPLAAESVARPDSPTPQSLVAPSPQPATASSPPPSPLPSLFSHLHSHQMSGQVNGVNMGEEEEEEEDEALGRQQEEEGEEEVMSAPPSPTPAVALFPGEGTGTAAGPQPTESPPTSPPSVPPLMPGFMAQEDALSTSSAMSAVPEPSVVGGGGVAEDELDLQLFRRDGVTVSPTATGTPGATGLRFPCGVCGKRFRFQSILSLHARAHRLDRQRRTNAPYHTGAVSTDGGQKLPASLQLPSSLDLLQAKSEEQKLDKSSQGVLGPEVKKALDIGNGGSQGTLPGRVPSPERRVNRRKRTLHGRRQHSMDLGVDRRLEHSLLVQNFVSSPAENFMQHEDSLQSSFFSPHYVTDLFPDPPLTPPLTKESPIRTARSSSPHSHLSEDSSLQMSITAAATSVSFRCNECKGKFRTASELARHTRILHNPYKCALCPFSAAQEDQLAGHMQQSHSATPSIKPRAPVIAQHLKGAPVPVSTSEVPVSTVPHQSILRENHSQSDGTSVITMAALNTSCAKVPTNTKTSVIASAPAMGVTTGVGLITGAGASQGNNGSISSNSGAALPAFRCETCGQRFTQSWFLKGHMRKHKASLDHKCQVCGRGFKEPWFLKNHMKVHLNKLGLKAGLAGLGLGANTADESTTKTGGGGGRGGSRGGGSKSSNQSLSALYSSLLLSQSAGGAGASALHGGVGVGGSRAERELAAAAAAVAAAAAATASGRTNSSGGSGKSSLLSYLGLPGSDGASCVERLQAVAQVAEMGNGDHRERERVRNEHSNHDLILSGFGSSHSNEVAEQAAMWQLIARSLTAAQQTHLQQQQQQQQQRPRSRAQQPQHQPRGSVAGEAEQLRAYLGGLAGFSRQDSDRDREREEQLLAGLSSSSLVAAEAALGESGPWKCPDCGKLFRSLQQVVVHARVHLPQKPQHKSHRRAADEDGAASYLSGAGGAEGGRRRGSGSSGNGSIISGAEIQTEPSQASTSLPSGFHPLLSPFSGENGVTGSSSSSPLATKERVRGKGMKDCPYCGKAFRSSHHLKVHLRVHTGERPYKCPHCDYAGTQSGSLKYHLQRHHREQRQALASSTSSSPGLPTPPRSGSGAELSSTPSKQQQQTRPSIPPIASATQSQLQAQLQLQPSHQVLAQLASFGKTSGTTTTNPAGNATMTTEAATSRHSQAWLRGAKEDRGKKGSAVRASSAAADALREGSLESQYHFLSGMLGMALYQGGMTEASWLGELGSGPPPAKLAKVSRRKPLTTNRMVPANGHHATGSTAGAGMMTSSSSSMSPSSPPSPSPSPRRALEGGFEPLDLSRRNPLELSGEPTEMERSRERKRERDGEERAGEGGEGEEEGVALTPSHCLFCPFRTSSAELMAMHLQVNHTSKSRRKRNPLLFSDRTTGSTTPTPPTVPESTMTSEASAYSLQPSVESDQLALWRYVNGQQELPSTPPKTGFQRDHPGMDGVWLRAGENGLSLNTEEGDEEEETGEEEEDDTLPTGSRKEEMNLERNALKLTVSAQGKATDNDSQDRVIEEEVNNDEEEDEDEEEHQDAEEEGDERGEERMGRYDEDEVEEERCEAFAPTHSEASAGGSLARSPRMEASVMGD